MHISNAFGLAVPSYGPFSFISPLWHCPIWPSPGQTKLANIQQHLYRTLKTSYIQRFLKIYSVRGRPFDSEGGGLIIYFHHVLGRKIYFRVNRGQNIYFQSQQIFEKAKKKKKKRKKKEKKKKEEKKKGGGVSVRV